MIDQEPKYRFEDGRVINRASGEVIPLDEPIMVFRARDRHAVSLIEFYRSIVKDEDHRGAVEKRLNDFMSFRAVHPDRMKEPDTEAAAP